MNRQALVPSRVKNAPPSLGSILQRKCACGQHTAGGKCDDCGEKEQWLQRKEASGTEHTGVPPIVNEVLRSPGQPLASAARAFMEPRFGHDFGQVRVHADARATESAAAVNALAYTVGHDVVFGEGQYVPSSTEGRRLLAHELTHVVQQAKGPSSLQTDSPISTPEDAAEQKLTHTLRQASSPRSHLQIAPSNALQEEEANRLARAVTSPTSARAQRVTPAVRSEEQLCRQLIPVEGSPVPLAGPYTGAQPFPMPPHAPPSPAPVEKCALDKVNACGTYQAWLDTFPAMSGTADRSLNASMPADLQALITGKLSARGGLPDCADVALLLRHYYLKAHGRSFSFMVGRDRKSAVTFTLGSTATDKEIRVCMVGVGTQSFQEERTGFSLVSFYRERGRKLLNLKKLLAAGLKAGDVFVWKRLPTIKERTFQGHAQTLQVVTPAKTDPKNPAKVTQEGTIVAVQGNMKSGAGIGALQQRIYSFSELSGTQDGDADIGKEPKQHEEKFFGAGPWKA